MIKDGMWAVQALCVGFGIGLVLSLVILALR